MVIGTGTDLPAPRNGDAENSEIITLWWVSINHVIKPIPINLTMKFPYEFLTKRILVISTNPYWYQASLNMVMVFVNPWYVQSTPWTQSLHLFNVHLQDYLDSSTMEGRTVFLTRGYTGVPHPPGPSARAHSVYYLYQWTYGGVQAFYFW